MYAYTYAHMYMHEYTICSRTLEAAPGAGGEASTRLLLPLVLLDISLGLAQESLGLGAAAVSKCGYSIAKTMARFNVYWRGLNNDQHHVDADWRYDNIAMSVIWDHHLGNYSGSLPIGFYTGLYRLVGILSSLTHLQEGLAHPVVAKIAHVANLCKPRQLEKPCRAFSPMVLLQGLRIAATSSGRQALYTNERGPKRKIVLLKLGLEWSSGGTPRKVCKRYMIQCRHFWPKGHGSFLGICVGPTV